jgi:hypothetical protein
MDAVVEVLREQVASIIRHSSDVRPMKLPLDIVAALLYGATEFKVGLGACLMECIEPIVR